MFCAVSTISQCSSPTLSGSTSITWTHSAAVKKSRPRKNSTRGCKCSTCTWLRNKQTCMHSFHTNRTFLQHIGHDSEGWRSQKVSHSYQKKGDGDSCGVLCCCYAEFFVGHRRSLLFDNDRSSTNKHRLAMWKTVLQHADPAESRCRRCGEEDSPKNVGGMLDKWVSGFAVVYSYVPTMEQWYRCFYLEWWNNNEYCSTLEICQYFTIISDGFRLNAASATAGTTKTASTSSQTIQFAGFVRYADDNDYFLWFSLFIQLFNFPCNTFLVTSPLTHCYHQLKKKYFYTKIDIFGKN